MKPETVKMLEEWKKEVLKPMNGISITRDYQPYDNQTIELIWFAHKNVNGKEQIFSYSVKNLADDVTSLNIQIDNVERNELRKILLSER